MAVSDPLLLCSFCSRSSTTIVCHFIHWTHARKPTDFERPFSSVLKVKSNSDFKIRTCFAPQFQRREENLTLKLEAINSKQKLVKNKKVDIWNEIFFINFADEQGHISDTVKWVYLQFIIRPLLLSALFIIIWSSTPYRIGLFPPSQYFGHADKKLGVMSLSDSIEEGGGWCFGGRWFRSITWIQ